MAIEILTIYPLFPILFIKGYGQSLMVFWTIPFLEGKKYQY
jgi:hypothetical protein